MSSCKFICLTLFLRYYYLKWQKIVILAGFVQQICTSTLHFKETSADITRWGGDLANCWPSKPLFRAKKKAMKWEDGLVGKQTFPVSYVNAWCHVPSAKIPWIRKEKYLKYISNALTHNTLYIYRYIYFLLRIKFLLLRIPYMQQRQA